MNQYTLKVGGKVIKTNGVNLESAIQKEGFKIRRMYHDNPRNPNGKYYIILSDGSRMLAKWENKDYNFIVSKTTYY